jgi:hypothetical protein
MERFLVTYVVVAFGTKGVPGESSSAVELRGITGGAARIKLQIWRIMARGRLPQSFMVRGILLPELRS